jgi:hypothetical protein
MTCGTIASKRGCRLPPGGFGSPVSLHFRQQTSKSLWREIRMLAALDQSLLVQTELVNPRGNLTSDFEWNLNDTMDVSQQKITMVDQQSTYANRRPAVHHVDRIMRDLHSLRPGGEPESLHFCQVSDGAIRDASGTTQRLVDIGVDLTEEAPQVGSISQVLNHRDAG